MNININNTIDIAKFNCKNEQKLNAAWDFLCDEGGYYLNQKKFKKIGKRLSKKMRLKPNHLVTLSCLELILGCLTDAKKDLGNEGLPMVELMDILKCIDDNFLSDVIPSKHPEAIRLMGGMMFLMSLCETFLDIDLRSFVEMRIVTEDGKEVSLGMDGKPFVAPEGCDQKTELFHFTAENVA